jgi:hypothetical protein
MSEAVEELRLAGKASIVLSNHLHLFLLVYVPPRGWLSIAEGG